MLRRFTSFVAHVLVACVPVFGLVMAVSAGTASAARKPVNARAAALAALEHLKIGEHATSHLLPGRSGALTAAASTNWSGYANIKASSRYTKVAGSWTEPRVTCGSARSLAAFWTGIDGFKSGTVEQDGTLVECSGGRPSYFSWWEMYPANAVQVVGRSVRPGDRITSSVTRSGTRYTLRLTDSTHSADSFSTTRSCAATRCVDSSAEWIAEAPSGSSGLFPLANFGTWTLKGATVKAGARSGTISSFPHSKITMTDSGGRVKAQPGPLDSAGNRFKITWKRSG